MEAFKAVMTFVGQATWPAAVVIIFLLSRKEFSDLLSAIRTRVSDPRQLVNITRQGISLAAIDAKVEILREAQQPIANRARRRSGRTTVTQTVPEELTNAANEYLGLSIADWRQRMEKRNELAQTMMDLAVDHHVSRDALATSPNEGPILTAARLALTYPERGDAERLLQSAPRVARLHVRYHMALAFGRLVEAGLVDEKGIARILSTLRKFEIGADESLARRLVQVRALIETTIESSVKNCGAVGAAGEGAAG
jgi:hypothetical protein